MLSLFRQSDMDAIAGSLLGKYEECQQALVMMVVHQLDVSNPDNEELQERVMTLYLRSPKISISAFSPFRGILNQYLTVLSAQVMNNAICRFQQEFSPPFITCNSMEYR